MDRRHGSRLALLAAVVLVVASGSTVASGVAWPAVPSDPLAAAETSTLAASPSAGATGSAEGTPSESASVGPALPSAYPTGILPRAVDVAPFITHGSRDYPQIALTIDDCSSSLAIQQDLAIFQRYRVNVTWFPIGLEAVRMPSLWRRVDAAGFPIANHTYSHKNLTLMTFDQVVRDIQRDSEVMASILGHPIMPLVRPYGGHAGLTAFRAAAAAGERAVVNWDTVGGDADGDWRNVGRIIAQSSRGQKGSIILLHANGPYTTQALPAIIANYRLRGFEFVTLGQLLGVDGPVPYHGLGPIPRVSPIPTKSQPSSGPTGAPLPTGSPAVAPDQVAAPDQAVGSTPAILVDAAGPARDDRLGRV